MQQYDTTFKRLFRQSVDAALRQLAGTTIARWHNVELPHTSSRALDLLGESPSGQLTHLEVQSTNDTLIPLRMAEYHQGAGRLLGRFPRQILLYVGSRPLRMKSTLRTGQMRYSFQIVDVRDLDGAALLASPCIGDNIIAILTRVPDLRVTIRRVLKRIATLGPGERRQALNELATLAGLRKVAHIVVEETEAMPILDDIMDHDVFGPLIRRSERKGRRKGREEGRQEGKLNTIRMQLEARFGRLPAWAEERLAALDVAELDALSIRVLTARRLETALSASRSRASSPKNGKR